MKPIFYFLFAFVFMLASACSDSPDEPLKPEPEPEPEPEQPKIEVIITVPEAVTVEQFAETTANVSLSGNYSETPVWTCSSSNPSVATADKISDSQLKISGVAAGQADISVACSVSDAKFTKNIKVTVEAGVIKILAIGNSFSQDAVEQYLYELAADAGIEVVIGNMYIGGCDIDKHLSNFKNDAAAYSYRKIVKGQKTSRESAKISEVLSDEKWNYISLQQASGKSGKYDTYAGLGELISGIAASSPQAKMIWHQTWAYAASSTHESFPAYDKDQMTMYSAIVSSARRAMTDHPELKLMVPSGTAIQNARTTYVGDVFNRDGYHLEVNYGRYTAACTWFEAIFGLNAENVSYAPATVSAEMAAIARAAAHAAVAKPDEVTVLTKYAVPDIKEGDLKAPVCIDFGPNSPSQSPWNNITTWEAADSYSWLRDTDGDFVNARLRVASGFTGSYLGVSGENSHGPITANGIEFPISAWKDGLLVAGTKGGGDVGPGIVEISGLTPGSDYEFTLLAVRFNGSRDARRTAYCIKGAAVSETKEIRPGLKIGSGAFAKFDDVPFEEYAVVFSGVQPDANGSVTIEVTGIDTGTAAEGHLNALVIARR